MGSEEHYRKDFEEAQALLNRLLSEREELEVRIAKTKRRIALLNELCDESDVLLPIPELDLGGLTDVCRTVLRGASKEWLNTTEIMSAMRELGFPLEKYKAPMASITTTVNRLVEAGEVIQSPRANPGATEYRWSSFDEGRRISQGIRERFGRDTGRMKRAQED